MRILFGIILGAMLTVGGVYLYDNHNATVALNAPTSVERPLVNWDVAAKKWNNLTSRARQEWQELASR